MSRNPGRIRKILIEETRIHRLSEHGYWEDDLNNGFLSVMRSYPREDSAFLNQLRQRGNQGIKMLDLLIRICSNGNRQIILSVVRRWAEQDNTRRAFLDKVDAWERCLRKKEGETRSTM